VNVPNSRDMAIDLPFTEPTHYGMGKYGWVTAHVKPASKPPLDLFRAWIDESFRAVAPKKLVAKLDGEAPKPKSAPVRPAKKKAVSRKRT
jgi:hypothetical protein